jgi:5-formyltetrahydrofolate cyclo-ligase
MCLDKEKIRNYLRNNRFKLSDFDQVLYSKEICNKLIKEIKIGENVLVYCSKKPEVETNTFIDYLLSKKINVIVPIIEKENVTLRLSFILTREALILSTFHVPEPIGNEIPASPEIVTTAIIPILGFDRRGGRIGYGSGYYDRFLSENPHIRKIGIAYSCQEISEIPMQDHDIRMDIIVTEKKVYKCNLS